MNASPFNQQQLCGIGEVLGFTGSPRILYQRPEFAEIPCLRASRGGIFFRELGV